MHSDDDHVNEALRGERAAEESEEGDEGSSHCRLPAAKVIGEHADHRGAEKDHPHSQGADPCYRDNRSGDRDVCKRSVL